MMNCTLEMVCFNRNQIYLHFDNELTITIESSYIYKKNAQEKSAPINLPVLQSELMGLAEHKITETASSEMVH